MESQDTLEYIGWGEPKAKEIWEQWLLVKEEPIEERGTFTKYAIAAIPSIRGGDQQENYREEMGNGV